MFVPQRLISLSTSKIFYSQTSLSERVNELVHLHEHEYPIARQPKTILARRILFYEKIVKNLTPLSQITAVGDNDETKQRAFEKIQSLLIKCKSSWRKYYDQCQLDVASERVLLSNDDYLATIERKNDQDRQWTMLLLFAAFAIGFSALFFCFVLYLDASTLDRTVSKYALVLNQLQSNISTLTRQTRQDPILDFITNSANHVTLFDTPLHVWMFINAIFFPIFVTCMIIKRYCF